MWNKGNIIAVFGGKKRVDFMKHSVKHFIMHTMQYVPWLLLLLGVDAFAALLLWLADIQAFYALVAVAVLATAFLFLAVCFVLSHLEGKREQAFLQFLSNPDEYHEELLLETAGMAQREYISLFARVLRDNQDAYAKLQMQLSDYEDYVESWAHETKTPLSLLTLILDNRREELPQAVAFKLDYARNCIQESIGQMLFYARLKGTRKDYLFEPVHLLLCMEEVLEDYKPLLEEKRFQVHLCQLEDSVYADRRGLTFLFGQIISNSIKYCGKEPELWVESFQKEGRTVLGIRDNGIGVKDCDLPYIFEKGFTGSSGEGRKKATGMGLYLAKEIAKDLNINLEAVSQKGQGFEMQVSFPVVNGANPSGAQKKFLES